MTGRELSGSVCIPHSPAYKKLNMNSSKYNKSSKIFFNTLTFVKATIMVNEGKELLLFNVVVDGSRC